MITRVINAYEAPRGDIERMLGSEVAPSDPDRAIIEPWAKAVKGPILDVGSGTGRWTAHLAHLGYAVEGLEPAERLLAIARTQHPSVVFHHGALQDSARFEPPGGKRWGGILAWYSVIHMGPDELPDALATLRARLRNDGALLMSFFSGSQPEVLQHPIAPAYRWPMAHMVHALSEAGFDVITQHATPHSPHAYVSAVATPPSSTSVTPPHRGTSYDE